MDRPGGGAGGPPALPSSWPRLDQKPDLGGEGMGRSWWGRHATLARPRYVLRPLLGWISFLFSFSKKIPKNPRKNQTSLHRFPVGRFVALAAPPGGGEFRCSALAGARTASSRRKAHCAILGLGAGGRPPLPVPCLFSPEQMARYAGRGEGGGAPRTLGSEQV